MKKVLVLGLIFVVFIVGVISVNAQNDIVRIHIRANSDSENDQNVKIMVRDEINLYLQPILEEPTTKEEAINVLNQHLIELKNIAEKVSGQDCRVTLGQEYFPKKTYNQKVYPEGEYTALIIEIGEGKGRNWWCVAFPNMCYTQGEKKVEYKSFFVEILERLGIL